MKTMKHAGDKDGTRLSLLDHLGSGDEAAWVELDAMYRPLIAKWLRRFDLQATDVDDLTQEVMSVVIAEVPHFQHNGHLGAFRAWLRTIACNRAKSFLRSRRNRPLGSSEKLQKMVNELEDPSSPVSAEFELEHDRHVIGRLLWEIAGEIAESTMTAFKRHVVDGESAETVAEDLGLSPTTVLVAKSRVLRRLRNRASTWMNETSVLD